jgi:hypothetical protein
MNVASYYDPTISNELTVYGHGVPMFFSKGNITKTVLQVDLRSPFAQTVLSKNPHYFDHFTKDKKNFIYILNASDLINMLKAGGIDLNKFNSITFYACNLGTGPIPKDMSSLLHKNVKTTDYTVVFGSKKRWSFLADNDPITLGTSTLPEGTSPDKLLKTLEHNFYTIYGK